MSICRTLNAPWLLKTLTVLSCIRKSSALPPLYLFLGTSILYIGAGGTRIYDIKYLGYEYT